MELLPVRCFVVRGEAYGQSEQGWVHVKASKGWSLKMCEWLPSWSGFVCDYRNWEQACKVCVNAAVCVCMHVFMFEMIGHMTHALGLRLFVDMPLSVGMP